MNESHRTALRRLNSKLARLRARTLAVETDIKQLERTASSTPGARVFDIIAAASELTGVSVDALKGERGNRRVIEARLAVYLVARWNGHSGAQIGRVLGCRDPSTVNDGSQECRRRMELDGFYRAFVFKLAKSADRRVPFAPVIVPQPVAVEPPVLTPAPVATNDDEMTDDLDDIELLSRAVAAHYATA